MKLPVGLALLITAAYVVLGFTIDPFRGYAIVINTFLEGKNAILTGAVVLIYALVNLMNHTGKIETLTRYTGESRFSLIFPALIIGLVPMPGGAIISAPMVDEQATKMNFDPEQKVYVNYWFRHMWEFGWPLYPAVILMVQITGFDFIQLFSGMSIFLVIMFFIGYFTILRGHPQPFWERRFKVKGIFSVLYPILIVLILVVMKVQVLLALGVVILAYCIIEKIPVKIFGKLLLQAFSYKTILLIYGAMVLKNMIEAISFGEVLAVSHGIIFVLMILLPFLLGLASGLTITGVGVAIPLFMMFFGESFSIWHAVVIYASSVCGILVSPAHLCLVLSADFFKTTLKRLYIRFLIRSVIPLLAVCVITAFLLYHGVLHI